MPKTRKPLPCNPKKLAPNSDDKALKKHVCWILWGQIKHEGSVGLSPYVLTKFSNMERNLAGILLKTSAKDKGILLNHCPFCGTKLEAWLMPHLKTDRKPKTADKV